MKALGEQLEHQLLDRFQYDDRHDEGWYGPDSPRVGDRCARSFPNAGQRMKKHDGKEPAMTPDEITHIITSELESSDHVEWSYSPQTGRFAIEGRYGSMELAPVMLAGFPYVAFGSSYEDHPGVNGMAPFAYVDGKTARLRVRGIIANARI